MDYSFLGLDLTAMPSAAMGMLKQGITWAAIGLLLIPVVSGALSFLLSKMTTANQPAPEGAAAGSTQLARLPMPSPPR